MLVRIKDGTVTVYGVLSLERYRDSRYLDTINWVNGYFPGKWAVEAHEIGSRILQWYYIPEYEEV